MIHKTCIIDKKAKISSTAKIGPYSVIGPNVEIGENVEIHSHVNISGNTKIGDTNKIFPFANIPAITISIVCSLPRTTALTSELIVLDKSFVLLTKSAGLVDLSFEVFFFSVKLPLV